MSDASDILLGTEAKPAGPFQSKRFQEGLNLLESGIFDAFTNQQRANQMLASRQPFFPASPQPGMAQGFGQGGGFQGSLPTLATKGQIQFPGQSAQGAQGGTGGSFGGNDLNAFQSLLDKFGGGGGGRFGGAARQPLGFQFAGQNILGQMGPQTTVSPLMGPNTTVSPLMRSNTTDFRFNRPNVGFGQRSPFQFQDPRDIGIPDVFTPQFQMAQRGLQEQFQKSEEERLADLNRRGLLTSGAATRSQEIARAERDRRLTDLASQFAIEQGKASLQEEQMQRGLEQERQFNQAAEIFRQQGASDEQARFLAGQALQTQQLQQAANLATQGQRFQQGLSGQQLRAAQQAQQFQQGLQGQQLRTQQQGQRFGEAVTGRQLGLQEEQLANLMRRQPLEDLFKLLLPQMGQIGGVEAQPGIVPTLIGTAAGTASSLAPMLMAGV